MDENVTMQIPMNSEEEEEEIKGDEFYEMIEAPKFVDLTAPDPYRHGDDRYWFCSRVGCDHKHEEEMDPETIYKNFLLRVMAARSPNIRLRKALYRKDLCSEKKCPRTVPAKPSKPRVSRLALISSISKRIVDSKVKVKPVSKQNATPNAKSKQKQPSVTSKALTTPRIKKQLSNPDAFRSVRNPKGTATAMPKNKGVVKTLMFHSPKKSMKTKNLSELKTPVKALCAGMKKLEITSAKKQVLGYNRPLPSDTSRKQLRGREVKSRVFDGILSQNRKAQDAKSSKCLKKNNEKNLQENHDFLGMEIGDITRNVSEGTCSTVEVSKPVLDENKVEASTNANESNLSFQSDSLKKKSSGDDGDDNILKSEFPEEIIRKDEKRDTSTFDDKENDYQVMESDDNENDDNRDLDQNTSNIEHKIPDKHETPKSNQKKVILSSNAKTKQYKETMATTAAQVLKHKKPKPTTNPKPFRLRTDERGILKEANLEKKHCPEEPLGEITPVPRIPGGNLQKRQHQNALRKNKKGLEQNENHNDVNGNNEKDQLQKRKISKERVTRKTSSTPQRHTISSRRKLVASQQECCQDRSAPRMGNSSKRTTKSASIRQVAKPNRMLEVMKTGQLGTVTENSPTILKAKEAEQPSENGTSSAINASVSPASRASLHGKKFTAIPKEPNFHAIHTPKGCRRRVA